MVIKIYPFVLGFLLTCWFLSYFTPFLYAQTAARFRAAVVCRSMVLVDYGINVTVFAT